MITDRITQITVNNETKDEVHTLEIIHQYTINLLNIYQLLKPLTGSIR